MVNPVYTSSPSFQKTKPAIKTTGSLFPKTQSDKEPKSINGRISTQSAYVVKPEEISRIREALKNGKDALNDLKNHFEKLPPDQLRSLLINLMNGHLSEDLLPSHFASIEEVQKLIGLLNEEQLLNLSEINSFRLDNMIAAQTALKDEALTSVLETKSKAILKEILPELIHFIHHIFEILISITGLNQIGGEQSDETFLFSDFGAQMKAKFYLELLAYPSTIFGVAYVAVGSAATAAAITALTVTAVLASVAIYIRYLRPAPKECRGLTNLNFEVVREEEQPLYQRTDIVMKIVQAFIAGKGALLIGDTGSGKTSAVRNLAQMIASGKIDDLLKPVQLFSGNTSSIKSTGKDSTVNYDYITKRYDRYRNKTAFFFDEVHAAFEENNNEVKTSNRLLTFKDAFPYVIAATTTKQFDASIAHDKAFMRRFEVIKIEPLKPEQVKLSLHKHLHKKSPELIVEKDILSYIIEKASTYDSTTSQVQAANSLLARAITRATTASFKDLEIHINELNSQLESMQMEFLHQEDGVDPEVYNEVKIHLQKENQKLEKKKQQVAEIKKVETIYLKHKHEQYVIAEKASKDSAEKINWLRNRAYVNTLSQFIQNKKEELGLPGKLDRKLIDSILSERSAALL